MYNSFPMNGTKNFPIMQFAAKKKKVNHRQAILLALGNLNLEGSQQLRSENLRK